MDKIKKLTFEAACKLKKIDSKKAIPDFAGFPKQERKAMQAHAKCVIMIAAANQIANNGKPWKAEHKNAAQVKYEARWRHKGGSSGFQYYDFDLWYSTSYVGSRLCFISYDSMKALCADNKHYIKIWNEYAV